MPCYEVRTMSVEFQAQNLDVLNEAIEQSQLFRSLSSAEAMRDGKISLHDGNIVLDLENKTAQVTEGYQDRLNELKRAYSSAALDKVAKMNFWNRKSNSSRSGVLRKF